MKGGYDMTGTGTENDPYVVDNIADFRNACLRNDAYIELSSDIDCNDNETMSDNFNTLSIYCHKIDGKGYSIRNIYTAINNNKSVFSFMSGRLAGGIYNLNFENVFFNSTSCSFINSTSISASSSTKLYNCNFSGIINTSNSYAFCDYYIKTEKCTFNFRVTSPRSSGVIFSYLRAESCEFRLKIYSIKRCTINTGMIAVQADNSYVVGSWEFQEEDTSTSQSLLFTYSNHSYVAMSMKNAGTNIFFSTSSDPLTCFYDNDLLENSEISEQNNIYALTTEQCKNRDYLNSIGFTVV